jgi:hypothetical protein
MYVRGVDTAGEADRRGAKTACLRLDSAILMEISDDWQSADKRYLVFSEAMAVEG